MLHGLGFRLSFCRRAASNLKRGSATPLCNHPLVFHFKGPRERPPKLCKHLCVSIRLCFLVWPRWAAQRACADGVFLRGGGRAVLFFLQWLARGGRAVHCNVCFFSSARCFCFWLVSGGCRPWLPLSLCVFGSRACVCVCSRGSGDGPARLCQNMCFFAAGRKI